jgi:hypothetical protein
MTPADLLAALTAIFPSFAEDWDAETALSHGYWDDTPTFQRIVRTFCQYLESQRRRQLHSSYGLRQNWLTMLSQQVEILKSRSRQDCSNTYIRLKQRSTCFHTCLIEPSKSYLDRTRSRRTSDIHFDRQQL